MARDLNRLEIIGRLTKDPEVRKTQNGKSICVLDVANNQGDEKTIYFKVVTFERMAENAGQYLRKGSKVLAAGSVDKVDWTSRDGKTGSNLEIRATDLIYLSTKEENQNGGSRGGYQQRNDAPPPPTQAPPPDPYDPYDPYNRY